MNPNEIVAQVEAKKARNLAVAARKRLPDAPDLPTFAERGYEFYWEQMRGVVGPANMAASRCRGEVFEGERCPRMASLEEEVAGFSPPAQPGEAAAGARLLEGRRRHRFEARGVGHAVAQHRFCVAPHVVRHELAATDCGLVVDILGQELAPDCAQVRLGSSEDDRFAVQQPFRREVRDARRDEIVVVVDLQDVRPGGGRGKQLLPGSVARVIFSQAAMVLESRVVTMVIFVARCSHLS